MVLGAAYKVACRRRIRKKKEGWVGLGSIFYGPFFKKQVFYDYELRLQKPYFYLKIKLFIIF